MYTSIFNILSLQSIIYTKTITVWVKYYNTSAFFDAIVLSRTPSTSIYKTITVTTNKSAHKLKKNKHNNTNKIVSFKKICTVYVQIQFTFNNKNKILEYGL